jgi:hypothetical protein
VKYGHDSIVRDTSRLVDTSSEFLHALANALVGCHNIVEALYKSGRYLLASSPFVFQTGLELVAKSIGKHLSHFLSRKQVAYFDPFSVGYVCLQSKFCFRIVRCNSLSLFD